MNSPAEHAHRTSELTPGFRQVIPGFGGELIAPGEDRYDAARSVWNAAIDRRPSLIARAHGTADVAAVIRYARDTGTPLSVRGGGHSAAGLAVTGGVVGSTGVAGLTLGGGIGWLDRRSTAMSSARRPATSTTSGIPLTGQPG